MQEMSDPSIALDRAREIWQKHGRSEKWIQQRMTGQETRNKLTDYWADHDIRKGEEFAILTNVIHQEWADVTVQDHKALKGLKSQNLRDQKGNGSRESVVGLGVLFRAPTFHMADFRTTPTLSAICGPHVPYPLAKPV
jgi:hypothetical protein